MNFVRDVVAAAPSHREALRAIAADGSRQRLTFGEVTARAGALAGTLVANGVGRGDVVLTLAGNRAEWVYTMLACFHIGAVALPCVEQSRAEDLRHRIAAVAPAAIVYDPRNREELLKARPSRPLLELGDDALFAAPPPPYAEVGPTDAALIIFTSGTSGKPKAVVHGARYVFGQHLQAEHWLDARPGDLVWCTAAAGWSKSARNTFIAPWLRGARAMLHDGRFDPSERLGLLEREEVDVLCMSPTEYRVIAKRVGPRPLPRLRSAVAAGEVLDAATIGIWREHAGVLIRDGYGQTETGAITGIPPGVSRPGSMGIPLPGLGIELVDGQLCVDPRTVPTFFLGYEKPGPPPARWHTGDLVERDDEGYLWFKGRADDVIVSAGYRIGPTEVEAALTTHPAVAEAAVVGAPHDERGEVVRAVVVLRDGFDPGPLLARELQEHVKGATAPYKYPRILDFARALPRTPSGKVQRALLRERRS